MGESTDFSLLDFEACFKQHKDNDDGLVTKDEMISFISKVVGVETDADGNPVWVSKPHLYESKTLFRI